MTLPEARSLTAPEGAALGEPRFEVMPFAKAVAQAEAVGKPLHLTVTTSPKHGIDRSLEIGIRLRELGHGVALHLATRMLRSEEHLEEILEQASRAGIDDLFVIGGDAPEPLGPYDAAAPVVELLAGHPLRPARVGIGAYPEGHPLIPAEELEAALARKAPHADYLVTQLCFDPQALLRWLDGLRARGIDLPLHAGAVGPVERRRLIELSAKIGVGPSLRFLRKQRGLTTLFRKPADTAAAFVDAIGTEVGTRGIAGFHFFTFNDLTGTVDWAEARL